MLTKDKLVERRVKRNFGIHSGLYFGKKNIQYKQTDPVIKSNGELMSSIISAVEKGWENSDGYAKLWNQIDDKLSVLKRQNLNQFPDDYYDLINKMRMDITRRRIEEMDFTTEFTQEITNPAFSKSIDLLEFIPFAGVFEEIKGTGDHVPMMEQKTGAEGSVGISLYGLGHSRSLEDELYNLDIFSLQKINAAVTRAHTAKRNDLCFGPMIALSNAGGWHASQQVAAVNAAGATYDVNLYLTLRKALKQLYGLLDPQTRQEISAPRVVLLVRNNVIQWDVQRVINGQLEEMGNRVENRSSLAIDEVWTYKGDTITVGPKPTAYSGVPVGTAYLFVPGPAGAPIWTLSKRQLTSEVGRGDVLTLSREQRAWYFGQGEYQDEFLGSSELSSLGSGFGYVVEIELPSDEEDT